MSDLYDYIPKRLAELAAQGWHVSNERRTFEDSALYHVHLAKPYTDLYGKPAMARARFAHRAWDELPVIMELMQEAKKGVLNIIRCNTAPQPPELYLDAVSQCTYKTGWQINLEHDTNKNIWYIQLTVEGTDSVTFQPTTWKSGKRYLSAYMCRQEVVGVVFGLIKDAETREMLEWFRYKGRAIYNPHLDPDALAELASKASSFNCRENDMTMEE